MNMDQIVIDTASFLFPSAQRMIEAKKEFEEAKSRYEARVAEGMKLLREQYRNHDEYNKACAMVMRVVLGEAAK